MIGVVSTAKFAGLDAPDEGTVYYPFVDLPNTYLVLRTSGDPALLAGPLRQAMHELDPNLAVTDLATGNELIATSLTSPRYLTVVVGVFAAAALILSVVGVYGVMAYFVAQRTRDIGIRLALGGDPAAMRRLIVRQGLQLVLVGVIAGLAAAVLSARLLRSLLFNVSATDPLALMAVSAGLLLVAALACLIPARRAARMDPAIILRETRRDRQIKSTHGDHGEKRRTRRSEGLNHFELREPRALLRVHRVRGLGPLPARHRPDDEKRFGAGGHGGRQGRVERLVGQIFLAGKKPDQRPPLQRDVIADGAAEDRITRFERIEDRARGRVAPDVDRHFGADAGERAQVHRKHDSDHGSVCTSTESTGGRSRTIGAQASPALADA